MAAVTHERGATPWPARALLCRPGIGLPLEVVDPTLEDVSAEEIAARPDMYREYEQVED